MNRKFFNLMNNVPSNCRMQAKDKKMVNYKKLQNLLIAKFINELKNFLIKKYHV